jgi:hypothetical protein
MLSVLINSKIILIVHSSAIAEVKAHPQINNQAIPLYEGLKRRIPMDIYRTEERKTRFNSPTLPGYLNQAEHRKFNFNNQSTHTSFRNSSTLSVSASPVMNVPDTLRVYEDYQGCFILESDIPSVLRSINESKMSAIARKSLNRDNFRIQGWQARKIEGSTGNPINLGTYRFEGVGSDHNEWLDWSILLKIIQSPANLGYDNYGDGDNQAHWNYWKRELLVYQSGWLETLPEGIRAPICYDTVEIPGNLGGIWLEDVKDSFSSSWPLHRYALAARHLGRLNGIYISRRELPSFPWLSKNRIRQWLIAIPWRDFPWDHPLAWHQFPDPVTNSFRSMLLESDFFLAKLEQVPKTICHGDTYPTNFVSRHLPRNQEQTVAMNWSQTGIEPLGDDLGQLVYGTYIALRGYKLNDISETLFTSYVNGLQDSGCRVDTQLVRFGYTASAAFRIGLSRLVNLDEKLKREPDYPQHNSGSSLLNESFETVMASEAYRLLDMI